MQNVPFECQQNPSTIKAYFGNWQIWSILPNILAENKYPEVSTSFTPTYPQQFLFLTHSHVTQ